MDRLTEWFVIAVKSRAIVRVQNQIPLGDLSEPQPDIILLKRYEDFYRETAQQDAAACNHQGKASWSSHAEPGYAADSRSPANADGKGL